MRLRGFSAGWLISATFSEGSSDLQPASHHITRDNVALSFLLEAVRFVDQRAHNWWQAPHGAINTVPASPIPRTPQIVRNRDLNHL